MKELQASKNMVAIVDDEDYAALSGLKWHAFMVHKTWYAATTQIDGKRTYLHRVIMKPATGEEVDHIDGDGLNNQRANLRVCTHQQNQQNMRKPNIPTYSIYKGVTKLDRGGKKIWVAQVKHNKKHIHCGNFETQEEAARAYNARALELFGEFANLNEIE